MNFSEAKVNNQQIFQSIQTRGIMSSQALAGNQSLYMGSHDKISRSNVCLNLFIRKEQSESLIERELKQLTHSPARGIYTLCMERSGESAKKLNKVSTTTVEKRVEASALFILDIEKLEHAESLEEIRGMRSSGECVHEGTIKPEAIIKAFIPASLMDIAQPFFQEKAVAVHMTKTDIGIGDIFADNGIRTINVPDYTPFIKEYIQTQEMGARVLLHVVRLAIEGDKK